MSSQHGHKHNGSHKFKTYTEYVKRFSPDKIEASLPEEKKESPLGIEVLIAWPS